MNDRRSYRRSPATGVRARMRTGQWLVVVDVSSGGALVEAAHPLRPGTDLDVHFEREARQGRCAARVVRCDVVAISAHCGITYRAGLSFSETCDWVCEEAPRFGCELPAGKGGMSGSRAEAGHEMPEGGRSQIRECEKGLK